MTGGHTRGMPPVDLNTKQMNTELLTNTALCPCGQGGGLQDCCLPFINGLRPADSAEALMRSRYTAYVIGDAAYLSASWHATTRPARIDVHTDIEWLGLTVLSSQAGRVGDLKGRVEFMARYKQQNFTGQVRENSRFIKEQGTWYYLDGDMKAATDISRNASCSCGSGKKFKKCCGQ